MAVPQASEVLYGDVQRFQLALLGIGRRLWRRVLPGDFDGSWARVAPELVAYTSGAQLAAARAGVDYVPAVLAETGQPDEPMASVRPEAFAGRASDGRSLPGLLDGAVVMAKRQVGAGSDPVEALVGGRVWLEQVLESAVADAARDATAAGIAVRQDMGWVRMVNPPCCSRCAVLAGAWYRWSTGFDRHPRCDCVHIPSVENQAGEFRTDATALAERGLITDLTAAQRERIDGGANLPRVLNESRDRWRQRMDADRRREKRSRENWASGRPEDAPPGTTIHELFGRLSSQVDAAAAMRSAGIAT